MLPVIIMERIPHHVFYSLIYVSFKQIYNNGKHEHETEVTVTNNTETIVICTLFKYQESGSSILVFQIHHRARFDLLLGVNIDCQCYESVEFTDNTASPPA